MTGSSRLRTGAMMRCHLLIGALAAALLVGCASTAAPPQTGPGTAENPLQRRLIDEVSGAGAGPHLEALQRIAEENGGNRATPGPGYDASVDYVADVLREAGFEVSTPSYVFAVEQPDGTDREINLRNVIAETRTGSKDRVVMAGAHLDSVPEGPGINDNGTGVAALLEIATRLGAAPAVTNAVRFGFWGAEEIDLDGSTQYVEALSRSDREKLMLYLNLDMLASPNPGYFVQGGVGDGDGETGPTGSAEVARVLVEQLAAAGVTAEVTTFDGESDYAAFVDEGIPSGGVLAGDELPKSAPEAAQWGGHAGENFDRCYHSACDRIENVDATAMDHFTDAVAGTLAHFAMSTEDLTNS
jgi:aminopeptidase S